MTMSFQIPPKAPFFLVFKSPRPLFIVFKSPPGPLSSALTVSLMWHSLTGEDIRGEGEEEHRLLSASQMIY